MSTKINYDDIEVMQLLNDLQAYKEYPKEQQAHLLYESSLNLLMEIAYKDKKVLPATYNQLCDYFDLSEEKVCPRCGKWLDPVKEHHCKAKNVERLNKRLMKEEEKRQRLEKIQKSYHAVQGSLLDYMAAEWNKLEVAIEAIVRQHTPSLNPNYLGLYSPLHNTGTQWENDIVRLTAYCWNEEDQERCQAPNFLYKPEGLSFYWYKNAWRDLYTRDATTWYYITQHQDHFSKIIDKCVESLTPTMIQK